MRDFKKALSVIFRVGISFVLLIFLFRRVDKESLFGIIKNSDKPLLLLAFLVFFFNNILALLRWEMLLKAVRVHLPLKRIVISFCGGIFFSLFLPSTIGGDLMRSLDLAAHTKKPREVIATVFLDRLSGYTGLVFLALLSLSLGWRFIRDGSVLFSIGVISAVLIGILSVLFNKFLYGKINKLLHSSGAGKVRDLIRDLHQEIHYFRQHKRIIAYNLLLSVIIQASTPLSFFIVALSMGLKVNAVYFFIFLPIISAITLLPISIGGLGLRDATTIFFFAKAGVARDSAFAMSLLNFSFILICGALGGLVYVLTVRHRRLQPDKPSLIHPQA